MKTFRQTLLFFLIFVASQFLQAQNVDKKHEKREALQKQKIAFVEEKLQLTESEKKSFLPVYIEFDKKREEFHRQKHDLMKKYRKNGLNMSDAEILKTADSFVDIDVQTAELEKQYLEKFKKLITPVKLLLLLQSEYEFKKELIKKMKEGKEEHPHFED